MENNALRVAERYEQKPHQWNLAIMITIGGLLWTALAFYITTGVANHSMSETAHPAITSQLKDIRADQIKTQIMGMDKLICEQPANNYYREELIRLITVWESLTEQKFPTQLLRCGK